MEERGGRGGKEEEREERGTIMGEGGRAGRAKLTPPSLGPDLHSLGLQVCSQPGFCCLLTYSNTSSLSCPERFFLFISPLSGLVESMALTLQASLSLACLPSQVSLYLAPEF